MRKAKNLGQYFTPDHVADFMIGLSSAPKSARVLEPSCGEGIFLRLLDEKGYENIRGYEIDSSLSLNTSASVRFKSFVSENFASKFDLIIGNPPYIRWKNLDPILKEELEENDLWRRYFNSLCDYLCIFVLKSVELLVEGVDRSPVIRAPLDVGFPCMLTPRRSPDETEAVYARTDHFDPQGA